MKRRSDIHSREKPRKTSRTHTNNREEKKKEKLLLSSAPLLTPVLFNCLCVLEREGGLP
jgi:hypothetical protein